MKQQLDMLPLVSIITVCFNSEKTIAKTLDSVLSQIYTNIEYILVDGKSTDKTIDIIKQYEPLFIAKNIKYRWVSESDHGLYDAMNKGIDMVTGEWVGIINSDDYYAGLNVIDNVVNKINQNPDVSALYADLHYVSQDSNAKIIRNWKSGDFNKRKFYFGWMIPHPTLFLKRDVYKQVGKFNLSLKLAADYELILRVFLKNNISVVYLPMTTVKMVIGGVSNQSFKNRVIANYEDRLAWRINGLKPYWFTLFLKPLRKLVQFFI